VETVKSYQRITDRAKETDDNDLKQIKSLMSQHPKDIEHLLLTCEAEI
jgi:hypothetical protein